MPVRSTDLILNFYEHAKQCQSTGQFCLPFCLSSGHLVEYSTNEAREALKHRLLRPLSSNLILDVTSKVIWSLQQRPQRPPEVFRGDIHMDIRLVKAMHFKSNDKFNL